VRVIDAGQMDALITTRDHAALIDQHPYPHGFQAGNHLNVHFERIPSRSAAAFCGLHHIRRLGEDVKMVPSSGETCGPRRCRHAPSGFS
jgi:hypothetical protein